MVWSGPLLALFILYHLAHLTLGVAGQGFREGQVYDNVVLGFSNPFVSAFYILAMLALGLHMYHGFWSLLQTLGLSHARWNALRRAASTLLAGDRGRRQHLDPRGRARGPRPPVGAASCS